MLLLMGILLGCKREANPPVIRLNATDTMLVPLHSTISLPTAIAFDREDLDISSKIVRTGSYDPDSIGYYPIQYEVTDAEGNVGRATCTLRVMVTPSQLTAYYDRTSDCIGSVNGVLFIYARTQDPNQIELPTFYSGAGLGSILFTLLPNGEYEPEVMPIEFGNTTITDLELSFSDDVRIITLDLVGVNPNPFQCSVTFTRR